MFKRQGTSPTESGFTTCESRDILRSPWSALAVFWLPAIAIIGAGGSRFWRTIVWTVALVTMGTACLAHALRCGRVHCYITGPFFLLIALVREPNRADNSRRRHWPVLPAGDVLGKVSQAPCWR